MESPDVWMSLAATPRARRAAVTRLTASSALASADPTDDPLTWTPMSSTSWFGVPVTVPVPVTVIRADPVAAASVADWALPAACPAGGDGAAPPLPHPPSVNVPVSASAARPPVTSRRRAGEEEMSIAGLQFRGVTARWTYRQGTPVPRPRINGAQRSPW